jgi:hypothetical protein
LELRFERWWWRSGQSSCSLMGDLAQHTVQLSAPLLADFAGDQSAFRLKVPQDTPPLWSVELSELRRMFVMGRD